MQLPTFFPKSRCIWQTLPLRRWLASACRIAQLPKGCSPADSDVSPGLLRLSCVTSLVFSSFLRSLLLCPLRGRRPHRHAEANRRGSHISRRIRRSGKAAGVRPSPPLSLPLVHLASSLARLLVWHGPASYLGRLSLCQGSPLRGAALKALYEALGAMHGGGAALVGGGVGGRCLPSTSAWRRLGGCVLEELSEGGSRRPNGPVLWDAGRTGALRGSFGHPFGSDRCGDADFAIIVAGPADRLGTSTAVPMFGRASEGWDISGL